MLFIRVDNTLKSEMMSKDDLIRAITESGFPQEVVPRAVFAELKAQPHTSVPPGELRSSNGLLISENYYSCQGIAFLDDMGLVGALAHNYPTSDPCLSLTGEWPNGEIHPEDPKEIFKDLEQVMAVHVYHVDNHEFPPWRIKEALQKVGIECVVHIPIKARQSNNVVWRDIVVDVRDRSLYIFPVDFDYGIKFSASRRRLE